MAEDHGEGEGAGGGNQNGTIFFNQKEGNFDYSIAVVRSKRTPFLYSALLMNLLSAIAAGWTV